MASHDSESPQGLQDLPDDRRWASSSVLQVDQESLFKVATISDFKLATLMVKLGGFSNLRQTFAASGDRFA
jgi:hypothetical protein